MIEDAVCNQGGMWPQMTRLKIRSAQKGPQGRRHGRIDVAVIPAIVKDKLAQGVLHSLAVKRGSRDHFL